MATFIATKAVDMGDLSELGLLSNFKQLKTPSVTDLSSFTATKGNVSLFITGSHMTAVLKVPSLGHHGRNPGVGRRHRSSMRSITSACPSARPKRPLGAASNRPCSRAPT